MLIYCAPRSRFHVIQHAEVSMSPLPTHWLPRILLLESGSYPSPFGLACFSSSYISIQSLDCFHFSFLLFLLMYFRLQRLVTKTWCQNKNLADNSHLFTNRTVVNFTDTYSCTPTDGLLSTASIGRDTKVKKNLSLQPSMSFLAIRIQVRCLSRPPFFGQSQARAIQTWLIM